MNDGIVEGIDYKILDEFCRVCKKINVMIWCSKDQIEKILHYFVEKGCRYNILVWVKSNAVPMCNGNWLGDIEYCLVIRENGVPKYKDGFHLKSKWHLSGTNITDKNLYGHPTIKPLELVKRHIEHTIGTLDKAVVLDPFVGSGTTCVATKELGYEYIGFEISEKYYKVAVDRLNGITKNGQTSLLDTDFEQLDLFDEKK